MPATSAAALKRKTERLREWKKQHPAEVRQQKKRYREQHKDKRRNELNRWRENNPEKVRAQKRRYRERKAWPRIPSTYGRRETTQIVKCNPDKIVLLDARVVLTDYRRTPSSPPPSQSTNNPQNIDDFDPDEILKGLFQSKSLKRKPTKRKPTKKQYESSDSEMDEELLREMEEVLVEPEDPVKRRIRQTMKTRKKAERNRVRRILKRQEEEDMIAEIASELDEMMLYDMSKWFAEFEREDTVEQASQFEYLRTVEITTELMSQLEQYIFFFLMNPSCKYNE